MGHGSVTPRERPTGLRLAYLCGQYPMLSMSFVLREVIELRHLGLVIEPVSINPPDRPPAGLTAEERAESRRTFYVKRSAVVKALAAHLTVALESPGSYLRGWRLVLELGGLDARRAVKEALYFSEGLIVGRWMRRRRLDHLHVHLASQAATVGLYVQRTFRVGLSITVHGPDEFYAVSEQHLAQKVGAADFVCCISHFARSQLMRLTPPADWSKLLVSRLGVDPDDFTPITHSASGRFGIVCVGRLIPAKGQHVLIDAVGRLVGSSYDVTLRVVGDGPDRRGLEEHVGALGLKDHVSFEGSVNHDRIRGYYAEADCFCIASFAEGIPVVLMEALAMQLPCVTTHVAGIPELIDDGVHGLLVAPSDHVGLADAIARLIDDPALGRRLGEAGRRRVEEEYELRASAAALAEVFAARIA